MGKTKSRANGDGDVFPRKNKAGRITSYRGAYVGTDGKRRYVSGRTKEEARRALREARANSDQGLLFDADNLKVEEYLDRWLADSVSDTAKATTFERYEQITRLHLKPALGRVKLKALTPAHVRGLYRENLEAGSSARTVRYIHTTLHKALKQAVMDGLIPRNATEGVKPPQPTREEMHPLTPEQAKLLLQVAHGSADRLEALYVLAIHTGLRQGELLDLTRRSFKPLLKRAELPQIRFHDLRHTCATLLLTRNVNPKIVSEMLGHSTIAITLDTYSHVLPNMRDQAAAAMEEALS